MHRARREVAPHDDDTLVQPRWAWPLPPKRTAARVHVLYVRVPDGARGGELELVTLEVRQLLVVVKRRDSYH